MKLDTADIEPEDFHIINSPEQFRRTLSVEDVRLAHEVPIVVRYDYVDLGATPYHFLQPFTPEDTAGYFSRMKEFAGKSVNKLLAGADATHFHRSQLHGNLLKAVKAILPKAGDTQQIVYHFSLYKSDDWADRTNGTRNSRVYFMLGTYGHVYILFFDPYHELNPL